MGWRGVMRVMDATEREKTMKLLLVEDDADLARWVMNLMQVEQFVIDWAQNGEQAEHPAAACCSTTTYCCSAWSLNQIPETSLHLEHRHAKILTQQLKPWHRLRHRP